MLRLFCIFFLIFSFSYCCVDLKSWEKEYLLDNAYYGIYVIDLDNGEVLLKKKPNRNLTPASLTKLYTTYLVAKNLGFESTFETQVLTTGPIINGVLKGNLILKGGYDPLFAFKELEQLVDLVIECGIEKIEGQVLLESKGSWKISHTEWEDLSQNYAPELSDLNFEQNCSTLIINPKTKALFFEKSKINPSITFDSSNETTLNLQRSLESNDLVIQGEINKNEDLIKVQIPIHNPHKKAFYFFKQMLSEKQIQIENKKHASITKTKLTSVHSETMYELVKKMNKETDNLIASILYHRAIAQDKKHKKVPDGSGLSRQTLFTPKEIVQLLKKFHRKPFFSHVVETLPVAGVDGSLADRFVGTIGEKNVKGKSGIMTHISSLAGYAKTKKGRQIAFCVIINQSNLSTPEMENAIDALILQVLHRK